MKPIDEIEVKTHFIKLRDRLAAGERIAIARRGVPADVSGTRLSDEKRSIQEVIAAIKQFRAKHGVTGLNVREIIEEGRA